MAGDGPHDAGQARVQRTRGQRARGRRVQRPRLARRKPDAGPSDGRDAPWRLGKAGHPVCRARGVHLPDLPAALQDLLALEVVEFPRAEAMLVRRHVDALAEETDAFHLEPHALLQAGLELQLDLAAGADDALPRQVPMTLPEKRGDVPVM